MLSSRQRRKFVHIACLGTADAKVGGRDDRFGEYGLAADGYGMVGLVKRRLNFDDSLDVFAVHGVGGAVGVLLTAIFADAALGGVGLAEGRSVGGQLAIQIAGLVAVLLWSLVLSVVIAKAVQAFAGLRVSGDTEEQGLDLRIHGERGHNR
jgi:Amt family ammonium transporter